MAIGNKNVKIGVVLVWFASLLACKPIVLKEAYYNQIKPGRKGLEEKVEFVFKFINKRKKETHLKTLIIHGYKGKTYHFEDVVLMNSNLKSTISTTKDISYFSAYVDLKKATSEEQCYNDHLSATMEFLVGNKNKVITINDIEFRGVINRRGPS